MGRGFGFVSNQGRRTVKTSPHIVGIIASRVLDEDEIESLREVTEQAFELNSAQFSSVRVIQEDEAAAQGAPTASTTLLYEGWQAPAGPWTQDAQEKWLDSNLRLKRWMADQVKEGRPVRRLVSVAVAGAAPATSTTSAGMRPASNRGQEKALSLLERREDGIHIVDVTPAIRHSLGYLSEAFILVQRNAPGL